MPWPFSRTSDTPRHGSGAILKGITWLFCLGLIAVGWLSALQQIRFEREQAIAEAIAQNENRVIAFEEYVQRTLEVASIATRYVADRFRRGEAGPEFLGTPERPAVLRGNLARTTTFVGIAIVNVNGDLIATSRPGARPLNVADNEAFRFHIARDTGQLYVSRPLPAAMLGRDVIMLTRRLDNTDGSFAGVVSLIITTDQFTAFYRDARIGPSDVMSVVGLDGTVRALRIGRVTSSGEDARGGQAIREQSRVTSGTFRGPSRRDGLIRYVSHRRLSDYPLFVAYGIPETGILAAPNRRVRVLIASVALGTLAILAFATVLTLLVNRNERRQREIAEENERLEQAQRIGEIGDWRYGMGNDPHYWSPQIYTLYERDSALGPMSTDEFRALLDEDGRAAIDGAMERVLATGEAQQFDFKVRLPSGSEAYHQVVAMSVRDDAGQITGVHGTTQNVTGRKLIEQLQAQVAHLSRVDAMNAMATTLAHELNQPLAAAANYLAGTRRQLDAAPAAATEIAEGVIAAEHQIHFAGDIIRQVREMVSNRPRSLSNFSLAPVIDDAVTVITAAGGALLSPIKRLDPEGRKVRADRVQVQQVIINLLRNAQEATRLVGKPEIVITSRREKDGMVMVSVCDNGPGFTRPEAERFSPVAGDGGAGMGLGLSISRTIVEANGGRIWTEDREEGGAVVCFSLPGAPQRAPAREAASA